MMYPPISLEAEQLLRSLIVDHVLCAGLLGAPRAEAASEELVAKGLIVVHPLDGLGRPTSLGARKLLDLLLREENAAPCRCGHTREEHTAEDPKHNTLVYLAVSSKIINGSPENAISTVPVMAWPHS